MTQPYDAAAALAAATDSLLATVDGLTDDAVRERSLLPGWTRGHVLAHIARNADAMRNLVTSARTGIEMPMYPSRERRDADIERDAPRPLAEHRRDIAGTAQTLAGDLRALPEDRLDAVVRPRPGQQFPARGIAWRRLREVEIHHVDLAAGYPFTEWPADFAVRCLGDVADMAAAREDYPAMVMSAAGSGRTWRIGDNPNDPTVSGPERSLLAWLVGRADGSDLSVAPAGPLPTVPPWA